MENEEEKYQGALIDPRTDEEKSKDYHIDELVANINPVDWEEKKYDDWRRYPIFDQDGSGSCVAQTVAKMLGVMYEEKNNSYVHFSATHVYQRRKNKPDGGMVGVDALQIGSQGVTLEELVPSQKMSDSQMDEIEIPEYKKRVGEVFKAGNYVQLPIGDIETIASVIQTTGKPVMVWYYFNHNEWTDNPEIKNEELVASKASRHSVTAVDYTLVDGEKCLIIDDSWGTKYGDKGQRIITEKFHKKRNFFAAYFTNFIFDEKEVTPDNGPKYTFTKSMRIGTTDTEVVALQDCLKYIGHYPANSSSTGYFGPVTEKAVKSFQLKYSLTSDGIVGPQTIKKLNEIFS